MDGRFPYIESLPQDNYLMKCILNTYFRLGKVM